MSTLLTNNKDFFTFLYTHRALSELFLDGKINSMNILITGLPQSGKTTLLKSLLKNHPQKTGFFTHEMRENGTRTGFEIETSV